MSNNIKEDLVLFNELITVFLEDELQNPVTEYISPKNVKKVLDIKLGKEGIAENKFKNSLKQLDQNAQ